MNPQNDAPSITEEHLSITEVERQTGIRQATLRMWEKRYGFPQPLRDRHGDRVYPLSQVERLQAARRLLDQGVRPSKIFSDASTPGPSDAPAPAASPDAGAGPYQAILDMLRQYRLGELHGHFHYRLLDLGLRRFVIEFLAPLSNAVGAAWGRGELPTRCEHLYSQLATSILHARQAEVRAASRRGPRVLLATLTGETHVIGILMVEAVLATLEVECIQLGSEVPPLEVAAAARETGADIVALSFSSYFPRKSVVRMVTALRAALPPEAMLWVGGDGVPDAALLGAGVQVFRTLAAIEPALLAWRASVSAEKDEAGR
ncbi:MerR family transcriptional regulator [Massilia sp. GCM10023247]|uniref:MerR family transcriptional regulator n=1 Tax=Massilia sp. GCM10023247 TaxID=3252643 RepID=UPI00360BB0AC